MKSPVVFDYHASSFHCRKCGEDIEVPREALPHPQIIMEMSDAVGALHLHANGGSATTL